MILLAAGFHAAVSVDGKKTTKVWGFSWTFFPVPVAFAKCHPGLPGSGSCRTMFNHPEADPRPGPRATVASVGHHLHLPVLKHKEGKANKEQGKKKKVSLAFFCQEKRKK